MKQTEIIIKGEIHTSRTDLAQERDLLVEGVDHLILEGPEEKAFYRIHQQWYGWIMLAFKYLFAKHIYTDHTILEDIADAQGAEVEFTRESDLDILHNSRLSIRLIAVLIFVLLILLSVFYGFIGNILTGSVVLLGSAMVPLLLLRIHESRRTGQGRDEKIAQQVSAAAQNGGRIIVITGHAHAEKVPQLLPENLPEPKLVPPELSALNPEHIKEILFPGFVMFSVLYVFYTIFLEYIKFLNIVF